MPCVEKNVVAITSTCAEKVFVNIDRTLSRLLDCVIEFLSNTEQLEGSNLLDYINRHWWPPLMNH